MIVTYNRYNSIFESKESKDSSILLDESYEFIQGFLLGKYIYKKYNSITKIETNVILDESYLVCTQLITDNIWTNWIIEKRFRSMKFLKALCIVFNVKDHRQYNAILGIDSNELIFIQFDSLRFLNGLMTYISWSIKSCALYAVFDNSNNYKVNIQHTTWTHDLKLYIHEVLNMLLSDLIDIVWKYLVVKCQSAIDGVVKCTNYTYVVNINEQSTSWNYTVYNNFPDTSNVITYTDNGLQCAYCRLSGNIEPLPCVTALVKY